MAELTSFKPNIHYIGVIEEINSKVVFKKYAIELPRTLLDALYKIGEDNDNGNMLALQAEMIRHYSEEERKNYIPNYLAPRSYSSSYVDQTHFPNYIRPEEYHTEEQQIRADAIAEYKKDEQERKERNVSPPSQPLEKVVEAKLRQWRISLRDRYLSVAIGFICSHSYRASRRVNALRKRPEVKMISTDTIGWTKYIYSINSDITIRFDSNFGFGRVSYFQLGISYKGIEIFPYSSYVRYYYANWRTLLRHTRSYEVKRRSWDYALEFVEKYANQALDDPDRFVNEFIIGEVKKMVDGLASIMTLTQERFSEQMNPENAKRPRYLGVSIPTTTDIECYAAYPREMLMAYKAEKVTGALAFLGKIKALSGIIKQVASYFEQIVVLVKGVLPDIRSNIATIMEDVARLELEKNPLSNELEPLAKEVDRMDGEIRAEQSKSDSVSKNSAESYWDADRRRQAIRQEYVKVHPEYITYTERCKELRFSIAKIDKDIRGRSRFAKRLVACEEVAAQTDHFKELLINLRPHEESIAALTTEALAKCDPANMKPAEIDGVRTSIAWKYSTDHPEYGELIKKRDQTLSKIDTFILA